MNPPANVHRLPNRETALKSLYDDFRGENMFPFWATSADVEHDEIKQLMGDAKAVPVSSGATPTTSSRSCTAPPNWSRWTIRSAAR